jgi:hypothetical protein
VGLLLCYSALSAARSSAEEFIEEIREEDLEEATDSPATDNPAPIESSSSGYWSMQLAIGGGFNSVMLGFRPRYHFSPWFASELSVSYANYHLDDWEQTSWTVDLPQLFFLNNPTMFLPYAGFGPGYHSWTLKDEIGSFDKGGSLIMFYLYGFQLLFSEHFALDIQMKTNYYTGDTPAKKITDRGLASETITREKSPVNVFSYGFSVRF